MERARETREAYNSRKRENNKAASKFSMRGCAIEAAIHATLYTFLWTVAWTRTRLPRTPDLNAERNRFHGRRREENRINDFENLGPLRRDAAQIICSFEIVLFLTFVSP